MNKRRTIVIVLRSGGDFKFRDVELITRHIMGKWRSEVRPRIICLYDKAKEAYELNDLEIIPLNNDFPGTWSRMTLYSPEMEQYKPFLYVDLDTAIISSLEDIFDLVKDESQFICLEDFWQPGQIATGLVWYPANCEITNKVWDTWQKSNKVCGFRMDKFLRTVFSKLPILWQNLTGSIYDFKPASGKLLGVVPVGASLICFHGKPRIFDLVESSMSIGWVNNYVDQEDFPKDPTKPKVTVIIPYKVDRGWLQEAINSVPEGVQLLVSQGEGNWPANFNKALELAEGKFIKYLHEDDMLTSNCIEDSVTALETQEVDFIHGHAYELDQKNKSKILWVSPNKIITLSDLIRKNTIHSATLMYRREIFEKIGSFNESLNTAEEFEFNLRCLKAGFRIGYVEKPLAIYRRHPAQKVRTVSKIAKDAEREFVRNMYRS